MARIINLPRRSSRPLNASEIWEAINDGRVVVHYQPIYDVQSREIIAAEALARIIDDKGNLVQPDRFIDRIERSDLIVPFGRRVIEQVCADVNEMRVAEVCLPRIAINLAAIQINRDHGLLKFIERTLARYGLDHSVLEFELTERGKLAPDENGRLVLGALADRGSRIVIDDFAIGESSVAMLTELPFSAFKVEKTLISRLPEDESARTEMQALISLAERLQLDVVGEGIETAAQDTYLAQTACDYGQGFGYARPMPLDELMLFTKRERTPPGR